MPLADELLGDGGDGHNRNGDECHAPLVGETSLAGELIDRMDVLFRVGSHIFSLISQCSRGVRRTRKLNHK